MRVESLKKQEIVSFDQGIILMKYGEEHRSYKETSYHDHSSRSHTIFQIYIQSSSIGNPSCAKYSTLNLVDLAGSERLNELDLRSETLGEAGHINKSLFVLAHVVNKLAEAKGRGGPHLHIPYRDSKLTRLLQLALGGNSYAAIICTVSPATINYHQTLSTLRFATRAKIVNNRPKINNVIYIYIYIYNRLKMLRHQFHITRTKY